MQKLFNLFIILILILIVNGCAKNISSTTTKQIITTNVQLPTYEDDDIIDTITSISDTITFNYNEIKSTNKLVDISDKIIYITKSGNYELIGVSTDTQIIIDVNLDENVTIVLNNVNLTSNIGPIIYSKSSNKVIINIKENTVNYLSDSVNNEKNSSILIKSNLTINGSGTLYVDGKLGNGINTDGNLTITNGKIYVNALSNALKINEETKIKNSNLIFTSKKDGINSKGNIFIDNGKITISSNGKGIHSNNKITIFDGNIEIINSYEGIEATNMVIHNGNIKIKAIEDGINISGETNSLPTLTINGGYTFIDASGDGIDSNGNIIINDGLVIVCGPTDNDNGALDYDLSLNIHGGTLIAVGSIGMARNASPSSSQNSIKITLNEITDSLFRLEANGKDIITFKAPKTYQTIVISSKELNYNDTYNFYLGGNVTNSSSNLDGYYKDGSYQNGNLELSFNISSIITNVKK